MKKRSYTFKLLPVLFLLNSSSRWCYNLDPDYSAIINKGDNSFFGYSLTFYENNSFKSLLIGAPKENNYTGALYNCPFQPNKYSFSCDKLPLISAETGSWLGATIVSSNGTALVCAPRSGINVAGRCLYSHERLDIFNPYTPSTDAFCEFGFSAALSQVGPQGIIQIFVGGPATSQNTGRLHVTNGPTGKLRTVNGERSSLFSYSTAFGRVLPNHLTDGVVTSLVLDENPEYAGKVYIVDASSTNTDTMEIRRMLNGYQPGEMFGASLAVSDLNGDRMDDIVIGAPHYTDYTKDGRYEIGAVYVYYKTSEGEYHRKKPNELLLRGKSDRGRFGQAVAAIGDTNADGFNDLAIGAPYENSGSGSVYIFLGSPSGLSSDPSQIIRGEHFTPPLQSFGFALSSSVQDLDGNSHTDLAAGAYQSNVVVYIPARPVVEIFAELEFNPNLIIIEERNCTTTRTPSENVSCSSLEYCLDYNGLGLPNSLQVNVLVMLDIKFKNPRLYFLKTNEPKMNRLENLEYKNRKCWKEMVYLRPNAGDKYSPMNVSLSVELVPPKTKPITPFPILNPQKSTVSRVLSIFEDCGSDGKCTPDLQIKMKSYTKTFIIQGSMEYLTVDIEVHNAGENAYSSELLLHFPPSASFPLIDFKYTNHSEIYCSPPKDENKYTLRCETGNPLNTNSTVYLRAIFKLQPGITDADKTISIRAEVNSTNKEETKTLMDNYGEINIDVKANASLWLSVWSRPEHLSVNMTALENNNLTTLQNYTLYFQVQNSGPSHILSSQFQIKLLRTIDGHVINKLTNFTIDKLASCDPIADSLSSSDENFVINCTTQQLTNGEFVIIQLNAQLVADGVQHAAKTAGSFNLTPAITGIITSLPFNQDVSLIPTRKDFQLNVTILASSTAGVVSLASLQSWVIALIVIGAIGIVGLIVFALQRCGFFERNTDFKNIQTTELSRQDDQVEDSP